MTSSGKKTGYFTGSDWSEYSRFEFKWTEILLTKEVIRKQDILKLLKHFEIDFGGDNCQETVSSQEIGNVLLNDIPKKELFPAVKTLFERKYALKLSFAESQ